jgi:hypothetical protein
MAAYREREREGEAKSDSRLNGDWEGGGEGRKTHALVGDEQDGPIRADLHDRLENGGLVVGIERGRALVEDKNVRSLDQRPGDLDPLRLSARDQARALAKVGVVPFGKREDELVHVGRLARPLDLGKGQVGRAVGDVVGDGRVEEGGRLGDDGDVLSEPLGLRLGEEVLVEPDLSGRGLVESLEEGGNGRLARARGADDGDAFAGGDGKVDALEDGGVGSGGVGEVDVGEGDLAGDGRVEVALELADDCVGHVEEADKVEAGSFGLGDGGDWKSEVRERRIGV